MCGRFSLTSETPKAAAIFGCETEECAPPRYNIAPTQPISVIFQEFGKRNLRLMRWGFVPAWVNDPRDFSLIINARCESVEQKPSFRSAIRHRRCIIPANGFYEWHREGGAKTPYFIKPKAGDVVGYAGIYETYASANGSEIDTVCFITTAANADIAPIHHRMPVLIAPQKADIWLDCVKYSPRDAAFFYEHSATGPYDIIPISNRVNAVKNDDPMIQERISDAPKIDAPADQKKMSDQLFLF